MADDAPDKTIFGIGQGSTRKMIRLADGSYARASNHSPHTAFNDRSGTDRHPIRLNAACVDLIALAGVWRRWPTQMRELL